MVASYFLATTYRCSSSLHEARDVGFLNTVKSPLTASLMAHHYCHFPHLEMLANQTWWIKSEVVVAISSLTT